MMKRIAIGLLPLLLCGCVKTTDELTLKADGSGTVQIETQTRVPPEMFAQMGGGFGMLDLNQAPVYPPVTKAQARQFFPGKDFAVTFQRKKGTNGETVIVVHAAFKNVNALLASPYGRAHQLCLTRTNGVLAVKAVSGLESLARFSGIKDDSSLGFLGTATMPGLAALEKDKNQMRSDFRITLPNPITAANGPHEGKTTDWVVSRQKTTNADEFATLLDRVIEARCPATGLTFTPVTPTRLALLPFNELAAGAAAGNGKVPDTNQVMAAAKFIPYGISITRSVDLSGSGVNQQNQAELIGAVVLPQELAPKRWGKATLEAAVDARGNDLKPRNANGSQYDFTEAMNPFGTGEAAGAAQAANTVRHVVKLGFLPPDWSVKKMERIKGAVNLYYFGNPQVIKLTNAIPANWIMNMSQMMGGGFNSEGRRLTDAGLSKLGLSLSLPMAMTQEGITSLMFQTSGHRAAVADFQVFDAAGKPWPTLFYQLPGGDNTSCIVLVPGKPKPPLSLALIASGGGSVVQVPISLRNVSITQN